jgi:NAD(P)-dependent dehydrogenase (short-subunit alcohol dehydrogenase family)
MREIAGKTALVTGVASGIGRAIALRLAAEGVNLFVVDIDELGLAETVQQAQQAGVEVIGRHCDVAEPSQVSSVVAEVLGRWGGVDILVNNAGITYYGPTVRMSAEHWDRVLRVNLLSHIQFTRELLPSLLARREAHIVNVCSMFGLVGMPKLAAYSTTKFALVGFSESLRNECGRDGLGVTALCPGFVDTNLFTSAPLGEKQKKHKVPPRVFRTTPDKVAHAAVKAIRRNRRMVVMTPAAWLLVSAKRFVPGAMDFVLHLGRRKRIERKMAQLKRAA